MARVSNKPALKRAFTLFFAAHPGMIPNYEKMAALDDEGRTGSSLEHQFRDWRNDGKSILEAKEGNGGASGVTSPKKVAGSPKKSRGSGVTTPKKAASFPKKSPVSAKGSKTKVITTDNVKEGDHVASEHAITEAKAATSVANGKRKRAVCPDMATSDADAASSLKKQRAVKKGVPQKLKQRAPKATAVKMSEESGNDERSVAEGEDKGKGKEAKVKAQENIETVEV